LLVFCGGSGATLEATMTPYKNSKKCEGYKRKARSAALTILEKIENENKITK
jgi:hypothetical protein